MEESADGTAALLLISALIDSMERASPGIISWIDQYMIEATSRPSFSSTDREGIKVARQVLAGLRGGLPS